MCACARRSGEKTGTTGVTGTKDNIQSRPEPGESKERGRNGDVERVEGQHTAEIESYGVVEGPYLSIYQSTG